MNTEEIFAKRDTSNRTLTVTRHESRWLMMNCRTYEGSFFDTDFYFRGYKVIVQK